MEINQLLQKVNELETAKREEECKLDAERVRLETTLNDLKGVQHQLEKQQYQHAELKKRLRELEEQEIKMLENRFEELRTTESMTRQEVALHEKHVQSNIAHFRSKTEELERKLNECKASFEQSLQYWHSTTHVSTMLKLQSVYDQLEAELNVCLQRQSSKFSRYNQVMKDLSVEKEVLEEEIKDVEKTLEQSEHKAGIQDPLDNEDSLKQTIKDYEEQIDYVSQVLARLQELSTVYEHNICWTCAQAMFEENDMEVEE